MGILHRLLRAARPAPAPPRLDVALAEERARYLALRGSTAACLYAVHKLAGEAAHQEAVAERAKTAAREALVAEDPPRSRAMVARARTALDLAREAEAHRAELRARADAALDDLRTLGHRIARLERERLTALADVPSIPALDAPYHPAELLEAERELDRELGG